MGMVKDKIVEIASGASRPRNDDEVCSLPGGRSYGAGFKPYYVAHTKIQTLALLDSREKGSNWSRWWRRPDTYSTCFQVAWTISSSLTQKMLRSPACYRRHKLPSV